MQAHTDLTGIAIVVLAALVCGIAMDRLRQPAVVGYILAGVLLGPSALGLIENRDNVAVLAELGVLMLLFFVGMELSLRGFKEVWRVALGAVVLQFVAALLLMSLFGWVFGWDPAAALVLGFVVAMSSTAVVVKMLEQVNILRQPVGTLTIGVLIAQDLAVVPILLTVSAMATPSVDAWDLAKIALSVGLLAALIYYLSRRKRLILPFSRVVGGHRDLEPLAGLILCFGAAALAGLSGLSPAFGAFLAGLVVGNSTARSGMVRTTRPIQSILLMVFFLSIGLLIDLAYVWDHVGTVLLLVFMVTVVKTALNIGILRLLREPWPHAFIAGVLLAQIGEFSLVIGQAGVDAGLLSTEQGQLIITVTALSLLASPLWLATTRRLLRVLLLSVTSFRGTFDAIYSRRWAVAIRRIGRAGRVAVRPLLPSPKNPTDAPAKEKPPPRRLRWRWRHIWIGFARPFAWLRGRMRRQIPERRPARLITDRTDPAEPTGKKSTREKKGRRQGKDGNDA